MVNRRVKISLAFLLFFLKVFFPILWVKAGWAWWLIETQVLLDLWPFVTKQEKGQWLVKFPIFPFTFRQFDLELYLQPCLNINLRFTLIPDFLFSLNLKFFIFGDHDSLEHFKVVTDQDLGEDSSVIFGF